MGVRLGGWRRIMPFLFSLPPLRHELCGSAKYVAMPGSSRGSACRASSVPSSCVAPVRAAAGSRENMASCAATLAAAVSSGTIAAMGKRVRRPTSVCRLRPRADDAVGLPLAETAPVVLPVWAFADRRAQRDAAAARTPAAGLAPAPSAARPVHGPVLSRLGRHGRYDSLSLDGNHVSRLISRPAVDACRPGIMAMRRTLAPLPISIRTTCRSSSDRCEYTWPKAQHPSVWLSGQSPI